MSFSSPAKVTRNQLFNTSFSVTNLRIEPFLNYFKTLRDQLIKHKRFACFHYAYKRSLDVLGVDLEHILRELVAFHFAADALRRPTASSKLTL